jgi:hypothetical protein
MKYNNHISQHCVDYEIKKWARKKSEKIISVIDKEIRNIIRLKSDKKACKVCGESALLCPYYFVERIYLKLKKEKVEKEVLNEFTMFFNFDFENKEYKRDMRVFGLI